MKSRIAVLLILSVFMLGCATTIYKPRIGFQRFDISNLDKNQYEIRTLSGSAKALHVLIFSWSLSPSEMAWYEFWPSAKRGYLFPFSILDLGFAEQEALYDALELSGCDVVLSYTKKTETKGIPLLLLWKKVTVRGKGITLRPE